MHRERLWSISGAFFVSQNFAAGINRGTRTALACSSERGGFFSAPTQRGTRTAAGGFAPNGRHLFSQHRLSGVLEPRSRFTLSGREVFRCTSARGFAVCGRRERCGARRVGAKRKDNLRFSFLFGLLPFPCFLIWRRLPICDRFEKEYGRGFFLPCFRNLFAGSDTVLLHMRVNQRKARHDSAAQILGTLYRTAPTNLDVWYNLSS